MTLREKAEELLEQIHVSAPKPLFRQLDESEKGIGFTLAYLVRADGRVVAGDIAKELNVSTARIAALLNKMEKSGLIARHTDAEDARRTVVEITPAGIEREKENRERILQNIELLLEKVGEEDLREFLRISRRIKNACEE